MVLKNRIQMSNWAIPLTFIIFSCSTSSIENEEKLVADTEVTGSFIETDRPSIELVQDSNLDGVVVSIYYSSQISGDSIRPRVAELTVKYKGKLEYLEYEKGVGLLSQRKQLIVQNPEPGLLRLVIVASDNTNPIGTGRLATLKFEKTDDAPATIGILTDKPIFAPEEANEGLLVSDPITI